MMRYNRKKYLLFALKCDIVWFEKRNRDELVEDCTHLCRLLREVREALCTPEGNDVVEWATHIMSDMSEHSKVRGV